MEGRKREDGRGGEERGGEMVRFTLLSFELRSYCLIQERIHQYMSSINTIAIRYLKFIIGI